MKCTQGVMFDPSCLGAHKMAFGDVVVGTRDRGPHKVRMAM